MGTSAGGIFSLVDRLAGCIVLASSSPRRIELLRQGGMQPHVVPSTFSENLDKSSFAHAADYCHATAKEKCVDVAERMWNPTIRKELRIDTTGVPFLLVVSADTIAVTCTGEILEKPKDREDARRMLQALSGSTSLVITAVCFVKLNVSDAGLNEEASARERILSSMHYFVETTHVVFDALNTETVEEYVALPHAPWSGKAGGYGIQDTAALFIRAIQGDYNNIVGFPLSRFVAELHKANIIS